MGNLESAEGGPGEPPPVSLLLPPGKMPMPEPCELEERFALVLVRVEPRGPRPLLAPPRPLGSRPAHTAASPFTFPGTCGPPRRGPGNGRRGTPGFSLRSCVRSPPPGETAWLVSSRRLPGVWVPQQRGPDVWGARTGLLESGLQPSC